MVAVPACFVTDATIGTWSSSWSDPEPHRARGARPPITVTGVPFSAAVVIALIPFVTPGPAVSAATPTPRVTFAHPSAAKPAVCSWRVSTSVTPASAQP